MTECPQRILVAIDGSPQSLQAGRLAIGIAKSWGASVRAIAVLGRERGESLVNRATAREAPARDRLKRTFEDALHHLVRSAASAGVTVAPVLAVRPEVEPYEVILDVATTWPADLLVVGRGTHHGIGRALLGSQTESVLEFATVPVLVVPARMA